MQSMGLLRELDSALELKEHFHSSKADILSRLEVDATDEEFLNYFRNVVKAGFDPATGIFTLQSRAFTPEMAQRIGRVIIDLSEQLINRIRDRALQDSFGLARGRIA